MASEHEIAAGEHDSLRRIDFFGPPGVGKSTIYQSLLNCRDRNGLWQTDYELEKACAVRLLRSEKLCVKKILASLGIRLPSTSRMTARNVITWTQIDAFEWFAAEYPELLVLAKESFYRSDKSEFRRAWGYHGFITVLMRWAVMMRWSNRATVVCDESITQKMFGVTCWNEKSIPFAREYGRVMPRPFAVISVVGPVEEIVNRIESRGASQGKTIPAHKDRSREDLHRLTEGVLKIVKSVSQELKAIGVPVLSLDISDGIKANRCACDDFVRSKVS